MKLAVLRRGRLLSHLATFALYCVCCAFLLVLHLSIQKSAKATWDGNGPKLLVGVSVVSRYVYREKVDLDKWTSEDVTQARATAAF